MSRTDKDAPYWVRAEYYEPVHDWSCPDRVARSWQQYPRSNHNCTLPDTPIRTGPRGRRSPRIIPEVPECEWTAEWLKPWQGGYYCYRRPRRKDRHFWWWGPDRAHVRTVLIKARQQYNGSGDMDVIEPVARPHNAVYSGGWWG